MDLTTEQEVLLQQSISSKIFIYGPAGTGKTTAGTQWLKKLMKSGIPAHQILVFTPQRALAEPYQIAQREKSGLSHSLIATMTLGGLARRMVDLFWPLISNKSGVANPDRPPHFLTLETAQYYMAHLIRPEIDSGELFESLTINRNRIYSQILDNLNKAALIGFNHTEIGQKLKSAWVGGVEQLNIYDDVQSCATRFRTFCLENNLLDFSLQVEIFIKFLWPLSQCRDHLVQSYRHLIVDNIEEDPPISHDILREWLTDFDSALVIFDEGAGYRYFLGADVKSAFSLRKTCQEQIRFNQNLVSPPGVEQLKLGVKSALAILRGHPEENPNLDINLLNQALVTPDNNPKYFPSMIQWVSDQIKDLVDRGKSPGEIVVLAPFMPDVLRFSLTNQLDQHQIPHRSYRPSRSLKDEPAAQAMLTLASTAFPEWGLQPKRINLAAALMQAIEGLDLVRAQLLTAFIYKQNDPELPLLPFETVPVEYRDRITYQAGEHYDHLRDWMCGVERSESFTLDFFMNRLFGEVLSQPGYGFHKDLDSGNTVANLIESVQKFRWAVGRHLPADEISLGKEYIQMVQDGVIAAQYLHTHDKQDEQAVFLAPAYTFLISNRAVDVQFWLDIGSPSWYQRLNQPLTQPYVLNRHWDADDRWDAEDELEAAHQTLERLSLGLLKRCREKVFLGMSELDVRGFENRGLLIR
ncbi:MAG: DEAD/DEAH box helicase family protein, partial [Brevefilum sp.]